MRLGFTCVLLSLDIFVAQQGKFGTFYIYMTLLALACWCGTKPISNSCLSSCCLLKSSHFLKLGAHRTADSQTWRMDSIVFDVWHHRVGCCNGLWTQFVDKFKCRQCHEDHLTVWLLLQSVGPCPVREVHSWWTKITWGGKKVHHAVIQLEMAT